VYLPTRGRDGLVIFDHPHIAESARWVGDSVSAVSVRRLCGSARVTLCPRCSPRWAGVYANIVKQGSLPPPVDWHPAED
jgi:hypothetical protein